MTSRSWTWRSLAARRILPLLALSIAAALVSTLAVAFTSFGALTAIWPTNALILLAMLGYQTWVIHAVGGILFLGRLIHGVGLSHGKGPGPSRMIGMVLTLLALVAAAGMLVICPLLGLNPG